VPAIIQPLLFEKFIHLPQLTLVTYDARPMRVAPCACSLCTDEMRSDVLPSVR